MMSNLNLFEVAESECFSVLDVALKNLKNFDINSRNKDGNTLLHIIAAKGNKQLCKKLILLGANPILQNRRKETILHLACGKGKLFLIKILLTETKVDANVKDIIGETAIFKAVRNGHLNILNYFLETGENIYETNNQNENLLNVAVKSGNLDLVKCLIKKLSVNHITKDGSTNLYLSIVNNYMEIIKYLIENGGDLELKYSKLRSLLHIAIENKNYELTKLLINSRINLNSQDENGSTPLHYATELQLKKIILLLLMKRADINKKDSDGYTCLHLAATQSTTDIMKLLMKFMKRNYYNNLKTSNGDSPLHLAASAGNLDGVILLNDGIVNSANTDGYTALRLAEINCQKEVVNYLLNYGNKKIGKA